MEVRTSYTIGCHWFAVRTNIKCERRAQFGLDALGYRTFLPQFTKWVSHARVRTIVKRPLLSRYLFVELDPNRDGFDAVRRVDGVESIVGNSGTPVVMPAQFVAALIRRQLMGEFDYAAKQPIVRGAMIKVVSGEWDELLAIVTGGSVIENLGSVMVQFINKRTRAKLGGYAVRAMAR